MLGMKTCETAYEVENVKTPKNVRCIYDCQHLTYDAAVENAAFNLSHKRHIHINRILTNLISIIYLFRDMK